MGTTSPLIRTDEFKSKRKEEERKAVGFSFLWETLSAQYTIPNLVVVLVYPTFWIC
jgi:hypothetical protein